MQHQTLLENYLRQFRLPTFAQNYQAFAQDGTRSNLPYERYLLALCQAEHEQREANRVERAIINAKFPLVKELASFDFSAVQGIAKTRVLELAQGGYMSRAETIILIVTTNLRFGDWNSIFGDEIMTTALLDRLTHKAHILEFIGESYRFRQRMRMEEQVTSTETG